MGVWLGMGPKMGGVMVLRSGPGVELGMGRDCG